MPNSTNSPLDDALAAKQQLTEREIVDVDEPQIKLVIFRVLDKCFAFPGRSIKEVLGADTETFYVPGMHDSIEGVINLRGDLHSVLRLNSLLQLSESDSRALASTSILLAQGANIFTGIRVDELLDVLDVPQSTLQAPMDSLPAHLKPFVSALLTLNDRPITLLDADLLLQTWLEHIQ